jgi:hypothetical protein
VVAHSQGAESCAKQTDRLFVEFAQERLKELVAHATVIEARVLSHSADDPETIRSCMHSLQMDHQAVLEQKEDAEENVSLFLYKAMCVYKTMEMTDMWLDAARIASSMVSIQSDTDSIATRYGVLKDITDDITQHVHKISVHTRSIQKNQKGALHGLQGVNAETHVETAKKMVETYTKRQQKIETHMAHIRSWKGIVEVNYAKLKTEAWTVYVKDVIDRFKVAIANMTGIVENKERQIMSPIKDHPSITLQFANKTLIHIQKYKQDTEQERKEFDELLHNVDLELKARLLSLETSAVEDTTRAAMTLAMRNQRQIFDQGRNVEEINNIHQKVSELNMHYQQVTKYAKGIRSVITHWPRNDLSQAAQKWAHVQVKQKEIVLESQAAERCATETTRLLALVQGAKPEGVSPS